MSKKINSCIVYLWKCTFERLVSTSQDHEGGPWKDTFEVFLEQEDALVNDTYAIDEKVSKRARLNSSEDMESNETYESYLVRKALQIAHRKRQQVNDGEDIETVNQYLWLYVHLLNVYRRYHSPLFFMPDDVRLGSAFNLHFFEPRYRLLIDNVMAPYPLSARNGVAITAESCGGDFPTFIYANKAPLQPGTIVCIVQVRQCTIYPNGTADVCLLPISYARINEIGFAERRTKLYGAIVSRLSMVESREIEAPLRDRSRRGQMSMEDFQAMLRYLEHRSQLQERSGG